jgi:murein DD-endopeptidase MepM/ murein hydrolase activator NlpD
MHLQHSIFRRSAMVLCLLLFFASAAATQDQPPPTAPRPVVDNPLAQFPAEASATWIADTDLVWGAKLAAFDLPGYLNLTAPHLSSRAEFMSHWCGFYSISPKVLLTLLEMRSGLVSAAPSAAVLADPLAGLVPGSGFEQQVLNALSALFQDFYAYRNARAASPAAATTNAGTYALLNLLKGQESPQAFGPNVAATRTRFVETLLRMFPEPLDAADSIDVPAAIPPTTLLQFPWKNGVGWYIGGVHTTTGSNDGSPMSSLDSSTGGGFGTDTSTKYVVAAHAGTVTRHSSCNVTVTATSGWQTNYYHLDGVVVTTGQQVAANQTLGVYASTLAQATCQGGSSTGPHVHYSLLLNGVYNSLDGVTWNGYLIHPGRFSYDTDQNYMWLIKDGVKYYANTQLMTSTASPAATLPNMTINDVSISEGHAGNTAAIFTVSLSSPAAATTTYTYTTSDVTTWSGSRFNTSGVAIPLQGAASPYPSTVSVPAGVGTVTNVLVYLRGYSHSWPNDAHVLLVGPAGQKVILMGAVGGATAVSNLILLFADSGMPMSTSGMGSSTYRPTTASSLSLPGAPAGPYGTSLSVFNGTNPTGTWSLYAYDEFTPDLGSIGSWELKVTTTLPNDLNGVTFSGTIASGASSGTFGVLLNGDTTVEPTETFNVTLSGAVNATITDSTGVGTIVNDDIAPFTDAPLTVGTTFVKAVHITELRTRINAVRVARGLDAQTWTDASLSVAIQIKAAHITEMRTALAQAYAAAKTAAPSYTDSSLTNIAVKAVHINELRAAVIALE